MHLRAFRFNGKSKPIGHVNIARLPASGNWKEQTVNILPDDTTSSDKLLVIFEGAGQMDIDLISLFLTDNWKGRPAELRADLVLRLADLHPGFLRFPGGCIVEGNHLIHR